jgi:hypothetical protein
VSFVQPWRSAEAASPESASLLVVITTLKSTVFWAEDSVVTSLPDGHSYNVKEFASLRCLSCQPAVLFPEFGLFDRFAFDRQPPRGCYWSGFSFESQFRSGCYGD